VIKFIHIPIIHLLKLSRRISNECCRCILSY